MHGIYCEVESCLHNVNKMCFCPVAVHLTASSLMGIVMLNCNEYENKDRPPTEHTGMGKGGEQMDEIEIPLLLNEG